MLAVQRAHRARANYSEEKKEELRRVNRERARQRRAHMTEEEKQLVRLRQRLNTRKKREAARQKQKEGNQTNFSKDGNQLSNQPSSTIPSSSSSMHSSPGLSIPHPQGFSHNQSHSLSPTRSHHQTQNQMSGQWGTSNLMSPPQVPYQRPGPIHPNNLILAPQSGYPPQRYDVNDFNDRAQMQNQLKMSMGVLEDCVRRLTVVEKDVLAWKSKFEAEVESRRAMEEWVLERFGVDLRVKFSKSHTPAKTKLSNGRGKKRRKTNESEERFLLNNETAPKIPPTATSTCDENLWSLDAESVHSALNLESVAYNALSMSHNIPPFNVIKEETVGLYSPTINSSSSIISYK